MTDKEEKLIVSRAKKGELAAFEELVTAYEQRIYALAFRSTGNEQDAKDITQDVFLRIYRSLGSFRGQSSFSTWVYRITMNICVDHARKNSGRAQTVALDGETDFSAILPDKNPENQPEAAAENSQLREELNAALGQISQEHRQIILLRDVSGLSYAEIAGVLELEEGTVKSRLARARKNLRDILIKRGNLSRYSASKDTEGRAVRL